MNSYLRGKSPGEQCLISVIIPTWNSAAHLHRCLESLKAQSLRDFEIILVDNGSTDGSLDDIEREWSGLNLRIKRLPENRGFSVANNIGARMAKGEWIALLNADAFPEPDWLERLLEAAKANPNAFFASRQLQAENSELLDGKGDGLHANGLAFRRGYGQRAEPSDDSRRLEDVFSACAAAALYPRQAFLRVGGFDEDYFAYQEDIDLGFRLRLHGLRCFYVPDAIVRHVGSASTAKLSDFAIYHSQRNMVWTFVKNMPGLLFWLFLPWHFGLNLSFLFTYTLRGQGSLIWSAKRDALCSLCPMIAKRRKQLRFRHASNREILDVLDKDPFIRWRLMRSR